MIAIEKAHCSYPIDPRCGSASPIFSSPIISTAIIRLSTERIFTVSTFYTVVATRAGQSKEHFNNECG